MRHMDDVRPGTESPPAPTEDAARKEPAVKSEENQRPPELHYAEARFDGAGGLTSGTRQFGERPVEIFGDRWVQVGFQLPGRPPIDTAELQAALALYLQEEKAKGRKPKQQPECVDFVVDQAEAKGCDIGRSTALRNIVVPVHHRLWPKQA